MPKVKFVPAAEPVNFGLQSVQEEKLLAISPNPEDHATLRDMADSRHWQVRSVSTFRDALERLAAERVAVVFCDDVLEDGTWKDLLEVVGTGAGVPPLVVTSRLADAFLWSEVLNLGGYDVLLKPFSARDVAHVLRNVSLQTTTKTTRTRVAGAA